jgi:hypothetical protein
MVGKSGLVTINGSGSYVREPARLLVVIQSLQLGEKRTVFWQSLPVSGN